jgi:hypothetical protein
VKEVSQIKESQLLGVRQDPHTGEMKGYFSIVGKGGKPGEKAVSVDTFKELSRLIAANGTFRLDGHAYRESLKKAAAESGQAYHGSHGLRWNYAQERYAGLLASGLNDLQAMREVSHEMGHNRIDITLHYLK